MGGGWYNRGVTLVEPKVGHNYHDDILHAILEIVGSDESNK